MDYAEAIVEVEAFRNAIFAYKASMERTPRERGLPSELEDLKADVLRNLNLVVDIAEGARLHEPDRLRTWYQVQSRATDAASELLGILRGRARRDEVLGSVGPSLSAIRMHPWVWQPAATQWDAGHRRDAVQRASTSVFDMELPSKVGRSDLKTLDLVGHVFSVNPPDPGDVRLRLPGFVKGTPEWTDAHKGARDFGLGCVAAIRNLITHSLDEPSEPVALEALAALSFFARRVDDAVVENG